MEYKKTIITGLSTASNATGLRASHATIKLEKARGEAKAESLQNCDGNFIFRFKLTPIFHCLVV
jgi:hypothetical protein